MKIVYFMLLSTVCALAIDCTTIDIEAEKIRLQNEMDVTSSLSSPVRAAQRKESEAFEKCLFFQDLNKGGYKRAKALSSLSITKNLTENEKKVYHFALDSDIEYYKKFDFSTLGTKNTKHLFYLIEEEANYIFIAEFFYRNHKIESDAHKLDKNEFYKLICAKDKITKEYIENELDKKFICEVPASKEYYGLYVLSEVNSHLFVSDYKIFKNAKVIIVRATDKKVVFRVVNETISRDYIEKRDRFDRYFRQVDLLNLDNF